MPQFRYRAVTHAGEIVIGEVDASSREEVVRRIEYLGHLTIDAEIASTGILTRGRRSVRKLPRSRDVSIFLRQLALLIGAGLTLDAALQTLGDDASKGLADFANGLRASISAGEGFADALEHHSSIIDPTYVAMVRVGEASGKLEAVLRAIVEDRTRRELMADRINSAIRYPLFLIGTAAVILLFFLIYVVPQFEPVFKDLGGRLNSGAALIVAASIWLRANVDVFLGGSLALVLGAWLGLSRREWRARFVAAIARLPGISGPMGDRRTARIVGTLGLLLENGVALPTALKILRDVVTEPAYVAAVDRVHEQVRNGRRFADALAGTDLLPPLAVRMLSDEDTLLPVDRHLALSPRHDSAKPLAPKQRCNFERQRLEPPPSRAGHGRDCKRRDQGNDEHDGDDLDEAETGPPIYGRRSRRPRNHCASSVMFHGSYAIDRLGGPASHGCVRLHPHHAAILFDLVQQEGPNRTSIEITDQGRPAEPSLLRREIAEGPGVNQPMPRKVRYPVPGDMANLPPVQRNRLIAAKNALPPRPAPPADRRIFADVRPPANALRAPGGAGEADAANGSPRPPNEFSDSRSKAKVVEGPKVAEGLYPEPASSASGIKLLPASCWSGSASRWKWWASSQGNPCK